MILTLQNSDYKLSINHCRASWSLVGQHQNDPALTDIRMGINYRTRRGQFRALSPGSPLSVQDQRTVSSLHGPLRQVELAAPSDQNGLSARLVFALAEKAPIMVVKMEVDNGGKSALFLDHFEFLNAGFVYLSHASLPVMKYAGYRYAEGTPVGTVRLSSEIGNLGFFSNGWQSWNYTGVYGFSERYRRTRFGPFTSPMRVNSGTPHHKRPNLFGSDMFAVLGDRSNRRAILTGFLSQTEQFGSIEALLDPFSPALRVWANADGVRLDPGSSMATDWLCVHFLHLDAPDPLGPYLDAVVRQNNISFHSFRAIPDPSTIGAASQQAEKRDIKLDEIPTGWCSWYHYFQRVSAQDIRENLAAAQSLHEQLPLDLIQIDDGFETQVGDWFDFSSAFPDGVAPLGKEIDRAGFIPGIWLAPFIVHPASKLARQHPDWLLRNKLRLPVNAGFIWDKFTTALDLTRPAAMDYVCEVVRVAARDWGYPYLKLDFLYAAALPGRYHDPTQTRAQVLRKGLEALRSAVGDQTYLLGCGCPLGSALGLVDAMRIGSDVDVRWKPKYKGISFCFEAEPDMPSARNAIQNTLTRAPLHRRWWVNDPDCLLLRPDTELTLAEVHTLATVISLTGGSLLLSDDLTRLPPDRLWVAEVLLPLIGRAPHLLDWFDTSTPSRLQLYLEGAVGKWHLVGLFNWEDRARDVSFHLNEFYLDHSEHYQVRSFWDGKEFMISGDEAGDGQKILKDVPAHGVALLALRKHTPWMPAYLGSDLHISQGLEVSLWEWLADQKAAAGRAITGKLVLHLQRPGTGRGEISLYLPGEPTQASANGLPLTWEQRRPQIYSFGVEFQRSIEIEISIGKPF
ncbi:MAG: alpha-galactosidase [Anaerolineales bacterium]